VDLRVGKSAEMFENRKKHEHKQTVKSLSLFSL
ncbi:uncharacterized protein METZ01_LOCUS233227, partial [marine metagenome]